MRIAVIGSGYVGLVSGACFSEFGVEVICVDLDEGKIARLKKGEMPIYRARPRPARRQQRRRQAPLLHHRSCRRRQSRRRGVHRRRHALAPRRRPCRSLLCFWRGRGDRTRARRLYRRRHQIDRAGRHRPQGRGYHPQDPARCEFRRRVEPRIPARRLGDRRLHASRSRRHRRRDRTRASRDEASSTVRSSSTRRRSSSPTIETAELTKYAANSFLATKISFINEIADLCEKVGADVQDVAKGIGLDGRIGRKFLHAGPGYGGSCFPKDCLALVKTAQDAGAPISIVEAVIGVNDARKEAMAERVIHACGGNVAGKTLAILGLTFKPNTDDMRDSPSARHHSGAAKGRRQNPRLRSRRHERSGEDAGQASISAPTPTRRWKAPTLSSSSPNGTNSARSICRG